MRTLKKGDKTKTIAAKAIQAEKQKVIDEIERIENIKFLDGIDPRLAKTFNAIEADSYSSHQIWKNFFHDVPAEERKLEFVQDSCGLAIRIGSIDNRPIMLGFRWFVVNGHPVLFYCSDSQLVDWKMIEDWIKKHMPHLKRKSDAQNAHNVLYYLED